jgi:endonuclease-3
MALPLDDVLAQLRQMHGKPSRVPYRGAFEAIIYECAAYLVDDERRAEVFAALKKLGVTPERLLAAPKAKLLAALSRGGMQPAGRMAKVLAAARVATELDEPLAKVVKRPLAQARVVLKRFPGVGVPGADRLAMTFGGHRVLALESNGLRVLTRLGFAPQSKDYAKTYRAVQEAVGGQLESLDLVEAHALLRLHGQKLCKASAPRCEACALAVSCPAKT